MLAIMGEKRNAYSILLRKQEGKRPVGRPKSRWVDNIKMDLREIGFCVMDWIDVTEGTDERRAVMNTVMNLRVL
jgi:hypothetical protein